MWAHQDDVRSLDEQGSQILAPSLGDATEDGSTTCAVLAWDKTKPCAEVTPALECLAGTDGGHHGGRDQRANAGHAHEATAISFLLADLVDLAGKGLDPLIERRPGLRRDRRSGRAVVARSRPDGSPGSQKESY